MTCGWRTRLVRQDKMLKWYMSEKYNSDFFSGELGCNNSWNYKLVMGKLPTQGPPAFITSYILLGEGQGDRGRSRYRQGEGRERLMEWGGCKGRERQSGDGKWQYNMIWFVVRNGFSASIFREKGDGARREPGRGTQMWAEEVGVMWTLGPRSSFSTGATCWFDSCWWSIRLLTLVQFCSLWHCLFASLCL